MSMSATASKVHKWLAVICAVPILFWFASGLFFAVAPIEQVRSEHVKAHRKSPPISVAIASEGLRRLHASGTRTAAKVEIATLLDQPVAVIIPKVGRPLLYSLATGRRLSPLPADAAVVLARRDLQGAPVPVGVEAVNMNSTEYRGPLPAWRVDFDQGTARSIYVAADTGAITARRSTLWRLYDVLWSFHIMDFKSHENFNTILLAALVALSLGLLISGLLLLPSRLRWPRFGHLKNRR